MAAAVAVERVVVECSHQVAPVAVAAAMAEETATVEGQGVVAAPGAMAATVALRVQVMEAEGWGMG